MAIIPCTCPEDQQEIRRIPTGARFDVFRYQCQRCGRKHGRKYDELDLPGGLHPRDVKLARRTVTVPSPSSLQRRRGAKRSSARFQAQRQRVLRRDEWTCQGCGEEELEQLEVHHVRYPEIPEDDVPDSDLQTVCGSCNLAEREDRLSGGQGGRVGARS